MERPPGNVTKARRLTELLLGEPLEPFVRSRREGGKSWRQIGRDLSTATNGEADLAPETIRLWFPEPTEAAS